MRADAHETAFSDEFAQRASFEDPSLWYRVEEEANVMGPVQVELDQDLVAVLEELHRPVKEAARELIVLELYRQGELSSGKAAQLLGLEREDFIRQASAQGIPYFQLRGEDLRRELNLRQAALSARRFQFQSAYCARGHWTTGPASGSLPIRSDPTRGRSRDPALRAGHALMVAGSHARSSAAGDGLATRPGQRRAGGDCPGTKPALTRSFSMTSLRGGLHRLPG